MAGFIYPSEELIQDFLNDIISRIDASGAGLIDVYTGTKPVTKGAATAESLVATLTMSLPCGTISSETLLLTKPISGIVLVNLASLGKQIGWIRLKANNGNFVLDAEAGLDGDTDKFITFETLTPLQGTLLEAKNTPSIIFAV